MCSHEQSSKSGRRMSHIPVYDYRDNDDSSESMYSTSSSDTTLGDTYEHDNYEEERDREEEDRKIEELSKLFGNIKTNTKETELKESRVTGKYNANDEQSWEDKEIILSNMDKINIKNDNNQNDLPDLEINDSDSEVESEWSTDEEELGEEWKVLGVRQRIDQWDWDEDSKGSQNDERSTTEDQDETPPQEDTTSEQTGTENESEASSPKKIQSKLPQNLRKIQKVHKTETLSKETLE